MDEKEASQKLRDNILVAESCGVVFPAELRESAMGLKKSDYRVAIVGKYQVGKTTLLNKVFLQEQLLPEGDGRCTTAVCTEIGYGAKRQLIVRTAEEERIIASPTEDEIRQIVVGGAEQERVLLARKYERVRLETGDPSLQGITLLDTPGIDDPNLELLDITTYNHLGNCDLVLYVAEARQLSEVDVTFLTGSIFAQGCTRVMVLLSYNPAKGRLSRTGREEIIESVKARIAASSDGDIPVHMYAYDEKIQDVLSSPDAIREVILEYLRRNIQIAREEVLAAKCRLYVRQHIDELRMRLELLGRKKSEVAQLQDKMESEIEKGRVRIERIYRHVCNELIDVRNVAESKIDAEVGFLTARIREGLSAEEAHVQVDVLSGRIVEFVRSAAIKVFARNGGEAKRAVAEMDDFLGGQFVEELPSTGTLAIVPSEMPLNAAGDVISTVTERAAEMLQASGNVYAVAASMILRVAEPVFKLIYQRKKQAELEKLILECVPRMKASLPFQMESLAQSFYNDLQRDFDSQKTSLRQAFEKTLDTVPDDPVPLREQLMKLESMVA